jgi:hypothetical protein
MPTDLEAVLARKREAQSQKEKQRQNDVTMISNWVVICLVMLVLLFVAPRFTQINLMLSLG